MKRIAVAGNPNSGKSCIFNNLTGARQRVGNYAGVTVEFVAGTSTIDGEKVEFIDLPGTYSLSAYSEEERVARNFILEEKPDAVLVVLDAANLERNLYFAIQLLELGQPVLFALNMIDVAEKKGQTIDVDLLGRLLGVRVVPTIAIQGKGMDELKRACLATTRDSYQLKALDYGTTLEEPLSLLEEVMTKTTFNQAHEPVRWTAIKLLEQDPKFTARLAGHENQELKEAFERCEHKIRLHGGEDTITSVVEARHAIASGASRECIKLNHTGARLQTDKIDSVVCHRFAGPLILAAVVYSLYLFVFKLADEIAWIPIGGGEWVSPMGLVGFIFETLDGWISSGIENPMLQSLLSDGIIGGVGGILEFTPLIFFMFLFISVLEDSGYIARVAFILDRLLRAFGLQGKSILALIVSGGLGGGGCAVPGVMATRTLREEKDRLVTILVAPMMNCGAKMPVFAMLVAAFFSKNQAGMMLLIWALSWVFALMAAWCLRRWVVKGEQDPFVMELPIYHRPSIKGVFMQTFQRTWMYVKKAGTIILAISVLIWASMYFPRHEASAEQSSALAAAEAAITFDAEAEELTEAQQALVEAKLTIENEMASEQLINSYAGKLGKVFEPVSQYAGFDWKDNIALIGGWAAKEVVIGTMGTVYAMGEVDPEAPEALQDKLAADPNWNPLRAFAMIVFVMIYAPCIVTLAAIKKETNSWKWPLFSTAYTTIAGFIIAVLVYQIGGLII